MEFNKKLQKLRKNKGITQEQLAAAIFVSRTAVSKWESGRGYPSIDSIKDLAKFFSVSIDELLSSEQALKIAEEDNKNRMMKLRSLTFGFLDLCPVLLLFLPLFGQKIGENVFEVSLLKLTNIQAYLKIIYLLFVTVSCSLGVFIITSQNLKSKFWTINKYIISLIISIFGVLVFIVSLQPYPATFIFIFAIIKVLILTKHR